MSGSAAAIAALEASAEPRARFARFAWGVLAYTVFVILFGAVVRITGSGAGCGQHWPTCRGEVVHLPQSTETVIELTHRVTSGLSMALVLALAVLAFRRFPKGHTVRAAAVASVAFMTSEALIGASLVLLELVGQNDSMLRAWAMAAHLVNTSLLIGVMAIAAWASTHRPPSSWRPPKTALPLAAGLVGVLLVSTAGAVTALGDTLYPVDASGEIAARLGGAHLLERLRIVHPVVAVAVSGFLLWAVPAAAARHPQPEIERWSRAAVALILIQIAAGAVNVLLSAPGWMQVLHLLLAVLGWLALVLLTASVLAEEQPA